MASTEASKPEPSGSLSDRISAPLNAASTTFTPGAASTAPGPAKATGSWADESASPMNEGSDNLAEGQVDGSGERFGGSVLQDLDKSQVEVKLSAMQQDEKSPLYSVKSFDELGLSQEILKGIYSMNFKKPSKVQEKALPLLLANPPTNMIAQSQSGTGKTAAFVLTTLSRVVISNRTPQALILAPSRELARQIEGVVKTVGQFIDGLVVQSAVPGSIDRDKSVEAHVVVGTPGTVMDLIKRRRFNVREMKVMTLDEADNMLDQQGMGDQCVRVKALLPPNIQILLFSATFPDQVMRFAQKFCPVANEIRLKHSELTVDGIQQMFLDCPSEEAKYDILVQLYGLMTIGSSIIFVKTRESAERIEKRMTEEGHKVAYLSGAQEGNERDRIIDSFRDGKAKVLITTNVLARGIDVQSVSMVINYDIPMRGMSRTEGDPETYLHRIGRTGRFGRVGVSITFVHDKNGYLALTNIANHYGIDLVKLDYQDWDYSEGVVQRVIKSSRAGSNFKAA